MYETLSEQELRKILGDFTGVTGQVTRVSAEVAGLDFRVDRHDEVLADHTERIGTLETTILVPPDLTALQAQVTDHESRIGTLETNEGQFETRVSDLEAADSAFNTRVGLVESTVVTHTGNISTLSARVDGAYLRLASLEAMSVSTEAELLVAIVSARRVYLKTLIALTASLAITTDYAKLFADGPGAGLLLQHDATGVAARTVVKIQAKGVLLDGLFITTNHPLSSHTTVYDTGIELDPNSLDISGLRVLNCRIHHVMYGIVRFAGAGAAIAEDVRIEGTHITSFGAYGIYMQARARGGRLVANRIFGREYGETHPQVGNGVWWGNFGDYFEADRNEIAFCGRHGIEFWNSQDSPTNTDGNYSAMLSRNNIHDMLNTVESFGISAFGNGTIGIYLNKISGCSLGIETYGDKTNLAFIHCLGNTIEKWGQSYYNAQGISINGVRGGKYSQNFIGPPADIYAHNNSQGIKVFNGASDLEITDNRFQDAGVVNLYVTGKALTITGITQAADGLFTVSGTIDTAANNGWAVGKRIYLTGIGGMTALNGKYYTITYVSGSTFKIGVNTSAMGAYTSGGRVMERWDNITADNNKFRRSVVPGIPGNTAFKSPLWLFEIQNAIVTNNRSWVKTGLGLSTFALSDWGTVYVGPTESTTVSASSPSDLFALQSTNMEVTFAE